MCMVSMVYDYVGKQKDEWWTTEHAKELRKIISGAKEFDEKTGQPNCESPEKKTKIDEILERIERLEKAIGIDATSKP